MEKTLEKTNIFFHWLLSVWLYNVYKNDESSLLNSTLFDCGFENLLLVVSLETSA